MGTQLKTLMQTLWKLTLHSNSGFLKFFVSNIYTYFILRARSCANHKSVLETWSEFENFPINNQKYFTIQFTCSESCALSKVNIKQWKWIGNINCKLQCIKKYLLNKQLQLIFVGCNWLSSKYMKSKILFFKIFVENFSN